jgi:predicted metalloprotease
VNALSRALLLASSLLLMGAAAKQPASPAAPAPDAAALEQRARALLSDANGAWTQQFAALGSQYPAASVTFFMHTAPQACGAGGALTGPFYCPDQRQVYLDLAFLGQISTTGSTGEHEAALAYVIGHELAHHVQSLLGTTMLVEQARARSTAAVSARTWTVAELQADCYAGIWLGTALKRGVLASAAELDAAVAAIAPVSASDRAHPPANAQMADPVASYGTAAQRRHWLQQGMAGGQINACDTFAAEAAGKL